MGQTVTLFGAGSRSIADMVAPMKVSDAARALSLPLPASTAPLNGDMLWMLQVQQSDFADLAASLRDAQIERIVRLAGSSSIDSLAAVAVRLRLEHSVELWADRSFHDAPDLATSWCLAACAAEAALTGEVALDVQRIAEIDSLARLQAVDLLNQLSAAGKDGATLWAAGDAIWPMLGLACYALRLGVSWIGLTPDRAMAWTPPPDEASDRMRLETSRRLASLFQSVRAADGTAPADNVVDFSARRRR